jgi:hypothetical protein
MTTPAKPAARPAPAAPKSPLRPVAYLRFVRPVTVAGCDRPLVELAAGREVHSFPGAPDRVVFPCPPMFRDAETGDFVVGEDRYPAHTVERYRRAKAATGKLEG